MKTGTLRRMHWLGRQALREMLQQRVLWAAGGVMLVMIAGATLLRELNFGTAERKFLWDYAEATLALGGTVLALVLPVTLVQGDAARGSLALTTVRGVRRGEWLLARWLAVVLVLTGLAVAGYAVAVWLLRAHGHAVAPTVFAEAVGRLCLRLWLTAAFALLGAVLARSLLLAGAVALGLTLAAQLADIIAWAGRQGEGLVGLWWVLGRGVPAFAAIEDGTGFPTAALYAGGYVLVYAALAAGIFSHREN